MFKYQIYRYFKYLISSIQYYFNSGAMEEPNEEDNYDSVKITTMSRKDKNDRPEKETVPEKTFQIDEALKESAVVETSENPYYVSADLNTLKVFLLHSSR